MEREKIIDRVRKLFSLASNNPSLEEAGSAMMAAQAMLARHSIDLIDLAENEDGSGLVEEIAVFTGIRNINYWQKLLASVIASNFRCKTLHRAFYELGPNGRPHRVASMNFIGLSADMGIAQEIFKRALGICEVFSQIHVEEETQKMLCSSGRKPSAVITKRIKNDWRLGFVRGLEKQFAEQVAKNNWAMILQTPAIVNTFMTKIKGVKDSTYTVYSPRNASAYESGQEYGRQMAGKYEERPSVDPKRLGPKE